MIQYWIVRWKKIVCFWSSYHSSPNPWCNLVFPFRVICVRAYPCFCSVLEFPRILIRGFCFVIISSRFSVSWLSVRWFVRDFSVRDYSVRVPWFKILFLNTSPRPQNSVSNLSQFFCLYFFVCFFLCWRDSFVSFCFLFISTFFSALSRCRLIFGCCPNRLVLSSIYLCTNIFRFVIAAAAAVFVVNLWSFSGCCSLWWLFRGVFVFVKVFFWLRWRFFSQDLAFSVLKFSSFHSWSLFESVLFASILQFIECAFPSLNFLTLRFI